MKNKEIVRRIVLKERCADNGEHSHFEIVDSDTGEVLASEEDRAEIARIRDLQFRPTGDNHHNAALCPHCGEPLRKALAEIERLVEALTPSEFTKREYMGEFYVPLPDRDENGEECMRRINVPWTVIKEIMAAIRKRALAGVEDE